MHVPTFRPTLVLYNARHASKRRGYIDFTKPAAANHIIVGRLGHDEILLIACDNGSIIGFSTDAIADAFAERKFDVASGLHDCDVRPFFVQDVGASACKSFGRL